MIGNKRRDFAILAFLFVFMLVMLILTGAGDDMAIRGRI